MRLSFLLSLALAVLSACGPAFAEDPAPHLSDTRLYKELAHGCHFVDLATWNHPTKRVLIKYKVPLEALELCNNGAYPIFHVELPGEPRVAINNPFYIPFISEMFVANHRYPMAFIAPPYEVVVEIANNHGAAEEVVEDYTK